MEERRFDDLTRALGHATSRRGVLKGLLGGLAAALAGRSLGAPDAAAAGCNVAKCERDALNDLIYVETTTCRGLCRGPDLFEGGMGACLGCQRMAQQRYHAQIEHCRTGDGCLTGHVCCGGSCTVVQIDPQNCGACGHACPPGEICDNGQCACGESQTDCDGQCIDTQSDHENCGSCGHACTGCEMCSLGECVSICTDDAPCCNDHCVSNQCTAPQVFNPATCQCECPGGDTFCDGQCVDIYSDDQHCGSCDTACSNCEECIHGVCQPLNCGGGEICCDGHCVNPLSDVENCGTCGHPCPGSEQCVDGQCTNACVGVSDGGSCGTGMVCCSETCVDTQTDPNNCGDCGITCKEQCVDGACHCSETANCDFKTQNWDPTTCSCVDRCTSYCEPNGYICCVDASGQSYCCDSGTICCDNPLGCCVG